MSQNSFFNEALSDFTTEVAISGQIRHLVDKGFSLDMILEKLLYPSPRQKVQKVMTRYMLESGIILKTAPENQTGQYLYCPFRRLGWESVSNTLSSNPNFWKREIEYLAGIPWDEGILYLRNDGRRAEICRKLLNCPDLGCRLV